MAKKTFVFTAKNSLEAGIAQLAQNGGGGCKEIQNKFNLKRRQLVLRASLRNM